MELSTTVNRGNPADEIRSIAERLRRWLEAHYGPAVKSLILYGSFARGTAREDSDVDFLVIVDDALNPWRVRDSLDDLLLQFLLETGHLVSVLVVPESQYQAHASPFLINVRREGIRL